MHCLFKFPRTVVRFRGDDGDIIRDDVSFF